MENYEAVITDADDRSVREVKFRRVSPAETGDGENGDQQDFFKRRGSGNKGIPKDRIRRRRVILDAGHPIGS